MLVLNVSHREDLSTADRARPARLGQGDADRRRRIEGRPQIEIDDSVVAPNRNSESGTPVAASGVAPSVSGQPVSGAASTISSDESGAFDSRGIFSAAFLNKGVADARGGFFGSPSIATDRVASCSHGDEHTCSELRVDPLAGFSSGRHAARFHRLTACGGQARTTGEKGRDRAAWFSRNT